jgi:hypothetical protein
VCVGYKQITPCIARSQKHKPWRRDTKHRQHPLAAPAPTYACAVSAYRPRRMSEDRKSRPFPGFTIPSALSHPLSQSFESAALSPSILGGFLGAPFAPAWSRPSPRADSRSSSRPASGQLQSALSFSVGPAACGASTMVGTVTSQGSAGAGRGRFGSWGLGGSLVFLFLWAEVRPGLSLHTQPLRLKFFEEILG